MSLGMYIASDHKLTTPPQPESGDLLSLNDLKKLENHTSVISELKTNLGIDPKEVDPNEKMFVFLDDDEEAFSVTRDRDAGTIHQYTDKPYIYSVAIYDCQNFFDPFSDYLQSLQPPFELWKIGEGRFEPDDLKAVRIDTLNKQNLEKLFGFDDYLNPIVGVYE
ncbi:hypothetical protein [Enterococcus sp.]|uniref:hypothetical protein n=1 Tax=Enterococcus sp. TaxID=35783 RepID=UPI0029067752|nr:hypothetical protein [Enterococcus sp.]MDU5334665.1 hypothetical protein [Enterococcus sp.]